MNDAEKREITEGLAKWMGFDTTRRPNGDVAVRQGPLCMVWDPFTNCDVTHLLLEECDQRGLLPGVARAIFHSCGQEAMRIGGASERVEGAVSALRATPEQLTLAVWEVVKKEAVT